MQQRRGVIRMSRKRLIREDSGAAGSEYVLILAWLAIGLLLVAGLGWIARETFAEIATRSDADAASRQNAASRQLDGTPGEIERPRNFLFVSGDWGAMTANENGLLLPMAGGLLPAAGLLVLFTARKGCPFRRKTSSRKEAAEVVPLAHEQLLFQKRNVIRRLLMRRMDNRQGRRAWTVRVQDVMTADPVQVSPDTSIPRIAELMRERKIRHVVVVDRTGRVLGVISDRDVCRARGKTAADAMSRPPITVCPDMEIIPAVTVLLQKRISCLPVVRDDKTIGILTATDVLIAFQAVVQSLSQIESLALPEAEETAAPAG